MLTNYDAHMFAKSFINTHISLYTHFGASNLQIYKYTHHFHKVVIYDCTLSMFTNYNAHKIVICNHKLIMLTTYESHTQSYDINTYFCHAHKL